VVDQDFVAGPGNALTILLQTGEHGLIAVIHDGPAKARNVARTSIVLMRSLRRRAERGQNKRKNKKQPFHAMPLKPPIK
jgi:hypothetical protein